MNQKKSRVWLAQVGRLPQSAARQDAHPVSPHPAKNPLLHHHTGPGGFNNDLLVPFSALGGACLPGGEVAEADVVIPANLLTGDDARSIILPAQFKRNAVLLHAGETVSAEKLPVIAAIRSYQLAQRNPKRLLGLLALIGLMFFALYKAATSSRSSRLGPRTAFWVAASALMIQTMIVRVGLFGAAVLGTRPETLGFGGIFEFGFAVPFATCALVLSLLIGSQVALVAGLMSALLVGFVAPNGMAFVAFALGSSVTAIYSVQRYRTRNAIIIASAAVGGINLLMSLAAMLIAEQHWDSQRAIGGLIAGAVGALLTAGSTSFAIPIYESAFDILTDMKLLELSNADNPLLQQLAIRTPGTNHHSYMVAVLAEEAAKAIGANALLARTGCLYHDIGKLAAPTMYIENQKGGPNPHDTRPAMSSARIIANHVKRGVEMAREANLPSQIIDFIPQHHGTRVLAYFYHKAKAQAEAQGKTVNIDDFRYPGPKPQTKEAVILMLGGWRRSFCPFAGRANVRNIRAIVKKICDTVIADGQFDESNITMRELTTIRESLINTLKNVYHERISYPGFNPPSENGNERDSAVSADGEQMTPAEALLVKSEISAAPPPQAKAQSQP